MTAKDGRATIGDQELALLRWLTGHGPASVGEAAEQYGAERGLARSTVLTMMERLRGKGHLTRRRSEGVYRYAAAQPVDDLMRGVVASFVERTLGGSVSPFVDYLAEAELVSDDELAELEGLVARLQSRRGEEER